jgi:hypothetical protein
MANLPKNTPQMTVPIKAVNIEFPDGTSKRIEVAEGQGTYSVSFFEGSKRSFVTHQCFIAEAETEIKDEHQQRAGSFTGFTSDSN